ncbi:unnamed protein product [Mortierella alpina]
MVRSGERAARSRRCVSLPSGWGRPSWPLSGSMLEKNNNLRPVATCRDAKKRQRNRHHSTSIHICTSIAHSVKISPLVIVLCTSPLLYLQPTALSFSSSFFTFFASPTPQQAPSTSSKPPSPPTTMTIDDKNPYAPLDWKGFFDTKRTVPISADLDPSGLTVNVYETNSHLTDVPLIVLHHGAGFCARSFATTARALKNLLGDQARLLSFDVRGHGETTSSDQNNLHVERLAKDLQNLLLTLYGPGSGGQEPMPELFLVGHSMGGGVVTEFAAQEMLPGISAVAVLDMAEMNLDMAMTNIKAWCTTRPKAFDSLDQVVQMGVETRTVRNIESARVSFPGLVTRAPAPASGYVWHTDLLTSESSWPTWFKDLNQKFLSIMTPRKKLLILAEYAKLDDELQAAYEKGEFQLLTFDGAGHFVQEDQPERLAKELVAFWKQRN